MLEENSAENGDALQEDISAENADALQQQILAGDNASVEEACDSCSASSSSSESSSEDESQECISCSEEVDTLLASDCEYKEASGDQSVEIMKCIAVQICVFLSFFQLCYPISERAISLLQSFLKILLSRLGSYCPEIKTLRDVLPHDIYFMRKLLASKSEITCFIVSKMSLSV